MHRNELVVDVEAEVVNIDNKDKDAGISVVTKSEKVISAKNKGNLLRRSLSQKAESKCLRDYAHL